MLDASDNQIGELPVRLSELRWLRVARLTRNHIADMSPFVGLTGCEELDLSQNEIAQIPDTLSRMTSLVTLDLSRNAIVDIPIGLCKVSDFWFGYSYPVYTIEQTSSKRRAGLMEPRPLTQM